MSDDKPRLITKWINEATDEQISHATSYMKKNGYPLLPYTTPPKEHLFNIFIIDSIQGHPYPLEKWVTFQKMTAHCRQKKHKLQSGKVQLSASIKKEHKEKLENLAKAMGKSQSEVIELLIENAGKTKPKQKQGRKGSDKSQHSSGNDTPTTAPKIFATSIFQDALQGNLLHLSIPTSGDKKDSI